MEIKYKKAVVTFIDVLGFKEIVKTKSADEIYKILELFSSEGESNFSKMMHEITNEYHAKIPDVFNKMRGKLKTPPTLKIIRFSDSIIRIRFEESTDEFFRDCVISEINDLSYIQRRLMKMGILIRGAVTIGDIHYDEKRNIGFGPGFIRAYELESQLALYPRIILDPSIDKDYIKLNNYKIENIYNICVDFDGLLFIDFLEENPNNFQYINEENRKNKKEQVAYEIKKMCELKEFLTELLTLVFVDGVFKNGIPEKIAIKTKTPLCIKGCFLILYERC